MLSFEENVKPYIPPVTFKIKANNMSGVRS